MYVVIYTRFNISFALNRLSQYFNNSIEHYKHTLKILFRYVRLTVELEIMYNISKIFNLIDYLNLNYILDKLDRKLIFEYYYIFNKELVL